MTLFPFAAFLAADAMVLVRTRLLPGWLGWIGAALGLLVGLLAAGSIIGLDIEPADQAILVLALVWVAALAICLDWLLPSASRRTGEALDEMMPLFHRAVRTRATPDAGRPAICFQSIVVAYGRYLSPRPAELSSVTTRPGFTVHRVGGTARAGS